MEPNYLKMSLIDLKQQAKTRHIKQYYIMKRVQLVTLLSMPELPESFMIEKLTIHQLRDKAKEKGIRRIWNLSRDNLVELLFAEYHRRKTAANQNQKYESDADKHDTPEKHHPENVGVKDV
jgi:hypothetical protein